MRESCALKCGWPVCGPPGAVSPCRRHHPTPPYGAQHSALTFVCRYSSGDPDVWAPRGRHGRTCVCMPRFPSHACCMLRPLFAFSIHMGKPTRAYTVYLDMHVLYVLMFRLLAGSCIYVTHPHALNMRAACWPCLRPHPGVLTRLHAYQSACMPSGRLIPVRTPSIVATRLNLLSAKSSTSPGAQRGASGLLWPLEGGRLAVSDLPPDGAGSPRGVSVSSHTTLVAWWGAVAAGRASTDTPEGLYAPYPLPPRRCCRFYSASRISCRFLWSASYCWRGGGPSGHEQIRFPRRPGTSPLGTLCLELGWPPLV